MTNRERILAMFNYQKVDKPVLDYSITQCGLYEHGDKLVDLFKRCPDDFAVTPNFTLTPPNDDDFDENGNYHSFETDKWGTVWEKRIFGIMGHPYSQPLKDMSNIKNFKLPPTLWELYDLDDYSKKVENKKLSGLFVPSGHVSLFEVLHSVRPFEDVLMDIYDDTPKINALMDMLCDYYMKNIDFSIKAKVDSFSFGDDFGMNDRLILSADKWRDFFKPRYEKLMKPLKENGIKITFHSCGNIKDIIPDLAQIGVNAIWPQLSCYSKQELADLCRRLNLAIMLHIDRAGIMTKGTPSQVKKEFNELINVFNPINGGAWLYVEIDNGFPFENIKQLMNCIYDLRKYK